MQRTLITPRRQAEIQQHAAMVAQQLLGDPIEEFEIGATDCEVRSGTRSSVMVPGCYRGMQPICDMQKVGAILRGQAAAAAWTLNIVPTTTEYFEPKAVRMVVTDNANPLVNSRAFITSVAINSFPQEAVDTQAPVAGTTAGWWSDDYVAPDGYGVPVGWGIFAVAALTKNLNIIGFHFAGPNFDVAMSVYGNALDNIPGGRKLGKPYHSAAQ